MFISALIDRVPIILEVPNDQSVGLMNRVSLPWSMGMIFKNARSFWMKNTRIALSIGFFDDRKRLLQINDMEPLSLETIEGPKETLYAVETNQDWYKDNKIKIGALLELRGEVYAKPK